jgi:tetratricopeptide (TPR) repeat protein
MMARYQGNIETSAKLAVESLAIYERLGEMPDLARGQSNLGIAFHWAGKNIKAEALLQNALLIFTDIGDQEWLIETCLRLGVVQCNLGKFAEARQTVTKTLSMARASGQADGIGFALWVLGAVAIAEEYYDEAEDHLLKSLTIYQQINKPSYISRGYGLLGINYLQAGDEEQARHNLLEALRIGVDVSDVISICYALLIEARILSKQGQPERAVALHSLCLQKLPIYRYSCGMEVKLREPLTAVADSLPPEIAAVALIRGSEMDLWQTAKSILTERD